MKSLGPLMGGGFQLAGSVILFVLVGRYFDEKYHSNYFVMLFGFIGLGIGLYSFLRMVKKSEEDDK
ncbi:MAG: AtpZ/AtpI family protein [Candidatus Kapabacteria bacterium]|nr:AtpZ/AtpI family protein [Candidatus Kapabacteria bacterium]